jgi:hypothetical protein
MRKFQLYPLNGLGADVTFGRTNRRTDGKQNLPTFSESGEIIIYVDLFLSLVEYEIYDRL